MVRIIVWEPQAWGVRSWLKSVGRDESGLHAGHVELESLGGSQGTDHYSVAVGQPGRPEPAEPRIYSWDPPFGSQPHIENRFGGARSVSDEGGVRGDPVRRV